MPTVLLYDALRESHERQRSLCKRLLRAKAQGNERRDLFKELRLELEAHAAAEERYLYVAMLMRDDGLHSSRHALAEHHDIEELLDELRVVTRAGRSWMATARKLSKKVHHHLKEEKEFFQVSGKILSARQKRELGAQYVADYERMKTVLAKR
jgi:Hemerythrin HHE cation binding domain